MLYSPWTEPLSSHARVDDLATLNVTFMLKIDVSVSVAARAILNHFTSAYYLLMMLHVLTAIPVYYMTSVCLVVRH